MLQYFKDLRVKRMKSLYNQEKLKAELFEREYIKERNRRMELESVMLTDMEKEYLRQLIQFDEVMNSHKHSSAGLYSELDMDLLNFTSNLLSKLRKLETIMDEKENIS